MPPFAARAKRIAERGDPRQIPAGFEALADALFDGAAVHGAVAEIGHRFARDGADIDDLLALLALTYESVGGATREPPFDVTRALARAWADASLRYLHAVSCEDPLTGLASLAHVRTRLLETYRESARDGERGCADRALIVVEVQWPASCTSHFDRLLRFIDIAEILRAVFAGEEAVGQLTAARAVAVVRRDQRIGDSVSSLLSLLAEWEAETGISTRMWIEGLPGTPESAEVLLDELAR